MTTNVVRVPGDYRIQTKTNGQITLDTGLNTGTVVITGSLDVRGTTTVVQATNASIKDNTLVLNAGETNSYVTLGTSGIIVDRGNAASLSNAATILYNDEAGVDGFTWHTTDISQRGIFEFKVAGNVSAIKVNAVRVDEGSAPRVGGYPRLNFFGSDNPGTVISVAGTLNYEDRVIDDDDIPNKAYVDIAVQSAQTTANVQKIVQQQTSIGAYDVSQGGYQGSNVSEVVVEFTTGAPAVRFTQNNVNFNNSILFTEGTITRADPGNTDADLYLEPKGNGSIIVRKGLRLTNNPIPPLAGTNTTALYTTGVIGPGGTGIYYVNKDTSGEFISRKRAIIYGLIF
jgi:hypothetical protein